MFLMFQLRRLDVWPTGDLGVRKGFGLAWGMPTPTPKQLEALGDPYRPYRSVVAWYCWRAAELYGGAAESALASLLVPRPLAGPCREEQAHRLRLPVAAHEGEGRHRGAIEPLLVIHETAHRLRFDHSRKEVP
jgi:hypothetical protein